MRGLGRTAGGGAGQLRRYFNAIPYLGYWDIYKNYYANKQEERGFVIHAANLDNQFDIVSAIVQVVGDGDVSSQNVFGGAVSVDTNPGGAAGVVTFTLNFKWNTATDQAFGTPNVSDYEFEIDSNVFTLDQAFDVVSVPTQVEIDGVVNGSWQVVCSVYQGPYGTFDWDASSTTTFPNTVATESGPPQLTEFPLDNIDGMRMDILEAVRDVTAFKVMYNTDAPYGLGLNWSGVQSDDNYYKQASQEGLGIKTYQSDLFNNWISTEWIDGTNGVNEVTAVSTVGNEFTIDALNLANKVYNMLNRIAISGGSYDDWLDAVYTHERSKGVENPVYHGSLIKELAFEEVVSQAAAETGGVEQVLGELAGRGRLTGKHKGGKIKIKVSEPSYIMGIVSITPRIDYSQGNKWDVNLRSMNDLHKPALDEIGFEDLITDQMAWFDTVTDSNGNLVYSTAGKQPAWINYMTNVNQCRGDFAVAVGDGDVLGGSMFMTLNRKYEQETTGIGDLTTYVDPSKYNDIFAYNPDTMDAQNFWVQISNKITARRKMSAKVIPNL